MYSVSSGPHQPGKAHRTYDHAKSAAAFLQPVRRALTQLHSF